MALEKYNKKRKFNETPEPEGKISSARGKGLRFVIQKHEATRLHYDFRLEVNGVLKSWAVPKGPSLHPEDKRLAMMVEDHPFDYRNFEGTIPEGNYGAGTVMLWDEGTYHIPTSKNRDISEKVVREEIKNGSVKITLHGSKLKGEFALVKLKKAEDNAWLLIKHNDEFANQKIKNDDRSVRSGRTMKQIAKEGSLDSGSLDRKKKEATKKIDFHGAPKSEMPTDIVPMLATLVDKPFEHPDWLFEVKWDGYRAIAEIVDHKVKLYSRNKISFNADYPDLVQELIQFPQMVLDGEIVVFDNNGVPQFQLMQNYRRDGKGNLRYMVFDILYYDGHDLRSLPLKERKEILEEVLPKSDLVQLSEHVVERGPEFLQAAKRKGLEGIIAKNRLSKYVTGVRSDDWLKIKLELQQEVVIGGYTKPNGKREEFGALLLGVYERKKLKYAGLVGTGFDTKGLHELKKKLDAIAAKESPFDDLKEMPKLAKWVEPRLVAEINFAEWTDDGLVRQASFHGLREDKNPIDVKREAPAEIEELRIENEDKKKSKKGVRSTADGKKAANGTLHSELGTPSSALPVFHHLDRVYWPKDKFTKEDLINYYRDISEFMLPYLKDRPQNLNRFPEGIEGQSFYHKDMEQSLPEYVETANIYSESNNKEISYMVCNNVQTLMYMGSLGCLEINPWNSRVQSLDYPDYLIFDLDPNEIGFDKVIETALEIRKILDKLEIEGYPKTSGKDGLHIYVPLEAKYTYDQTQQFGQLIAMMTRDALPKVVSLERSPRDRKRKVYIDYLQNRHGQTTAAAYSPRPRNLAPVSTPLQWKEVNSKLDPTKFTITNIFKRLDKVGDLWKPVIGKGIDLGKILSKIENKD